MAGDVFEPDSTVILRKRSWVFYANRFNYLLHEGEPYDDDYEFKLRINLTATDYIRHREAIIGYLLANGNREKFFEDELDAVYSFKEPTDRCRRAWRRHGRFNDNGQFTLYLSRPADMDKVQRFIDNLQAFLSNELLVSPSTAMRSDFALANTPNVSMRLERIGGAYQNAGHISRHSILLRAYTTLTRDTLTYARFAKPRQPRRTTEMDTIHRCLLVGYRACMSKHVPEGRALQRLAVNLRKRCSQQRLLRPDEVSAFCIENASDLKYLNYSRRRGELPKSIADAYTTLTEQVLGGGRLDYPVLHLSRVGEMRILTRLYRMGGNAAKAAAKLYGFNSRRNLEVSSMGEIQAFISHESNITVFKALDTPATLLLLESLTNHIDDPMQKARIALCLYINKRTGEHCHETGCRFDSNTYTGMFFSSTSAKTKLKAARKLLRYCSGMKASVSFNRNQRKACLRKRDRLYKEVIEPMGLAGLVRGNVSPSHTMVAPAA